MTELAVRAGLEMTEDLRKRALAWQHARSGQERRAVCGLLDRGSGPAVTQHIIEHGLVHVYTGEGKGKTTAALGWLFGPWAGAQGCACCSSSRATPRSARRCWRVTRREDSRSGSLQSTPRAVWSEDKVLPQSRVRGRGYEMRRRASSRAASSIW